MIKIFKKLIWLIKNQEKIQKFVERDNKSKNNYSLAGVPDYQLEYINDILEAEKK